MESMFSNMNHEGADEDWIPEDDVEEEHALLESVETAEIDTVQPSLGHCSNDQKQGIDV